MCRNRVDEIIVLDGKAPYSSKRTIIKALTAGLGRDGVDLQYSG